MRIGEYLAETIYGNTLLPSDPKARAHCRAVCGEKHSGFYNLCSALPMNLRARHPGFYVWVGAQGDIEGVLTIWREGLKRYGGPYLFGRELSMADAMYAPVCTRFLTYDVKLDPVSSAYCATIMRWSAMQQWLADARLEPAKIVLRRDRLSQGCFSGRQTEPG